MRIPPYEATTGLTAAVVMKPPVLASGHCATNHHVIFLLSKSLEESIDHVLIRGVAMRIIS